MKRRSSLIAVVAVTAMLFSTACSNTGSTAGNNNSTVVENTVADSSEVTTADTTDGTADTANTETKVANGYEKIAQLYIDAMSEDNYTQEFNMTIDIEGMPEYSPVIEGVNKVELNKAMDMDYSMWMGGKSGTKIMDASMNYEDGKIYMLIASDILGGESKTSYSADFEQVMSGSPSPDSIVQQLGDFVGEVQEDADGYTVTFNPNSDLIKSLSSSSDEISNITATEKIYTSDGKFKSAKVQIGADTVIDGETKHFDCTITLNQTNVGSTVVTPLTDAEKAEYTDGGDFSTISQSMISQ